MAVSSDAATGLVATDPGDWLNHRRDACAFHLLGRLPTRKQSFPVAWCRKRIVNGDEDNVWFKFRVLSLGEKLEEITIDGSSPRK